MTQSPLTPEQIDEMRSFFRVACRQLLNIDLTMSQHRELAEAFAHAGYVKAELENLRAKPTADHVEVERIARWLCADEDIEPNGKYTNDETGKIVYAWEDYVEYATRLLNGLNPASAPPQAAPGDATDPIPSARHVAKNWLFLQFGASATWETLCPADFDALAQLILRERTAARSEERERCAKIADTKEAELRAILSVTQNHRTELQATCAAENVKDVAKYIRASLGTE